MSANQTINLNGFEQMLNSHALLPSLLNLVQEQTRQIAAMREELARSVSARTEADGWLDAKAAANYLGISGGTFDKYRYQSSPKIPGFPLDGKTLYKKSDLDSFVRLYAVRSRGLA